MLSIKNEMRKQAQNNGLSLFLASSMQQLSTSFGITGPSVNAMERNGIPKDHKGLETTSDIGSKFCTRKYFYWRKSKISDRLSFRRVVVVRGTWFVVGGIPWLQFRKDKVMLVRS